MYNKIGSNLIQCFFCIVTLKKASHSLSIHVLIFPVGGSKELCLYVSSYGAGVHEVLLSSSKGSERSVNHLLAELGMAAPVVGSQLEMSIMAEHTGGWQGDQQQLSSYSIAVRDLFIK